LIFEWNYGLIAVPLKEAGVAKLADAPDLGSGGAILRGSSPLSGINDYQSGDCIAKLSAEDHSVKQVSRAKIANPVPDPFENRWPYIVGSLAFVIFIYILCLLSFFAFANSCKSGRFWPLTAKPAGKVLNGSYSATPKRKTKTAVAAKKG
jgi:hypothetical protein